MYDEFNGEFINFLLILVVDNPARGNYLNEENSLPEMRHVSTKTAIHRDIALRHIHALFVQAERGFAENRELAHRYMRVARRIAMKYKVAFPTSLKRQICKHCHHYLVQGVNCRVRLTQGKVVYYCMDCRHFMRFPYHGRTSAKRIKRVIKA